MRELPMVSIVIPVFNGGDYLVEAIESALGQDYPNTEIVVVNDGSSDEGVTERIALSYGDKIRYISKLNGGVASALNVGLKAMRGEYFSWLSHDDLYEANKISRQISIINESGLEGDVVVYSAAGAFCDDPDNYSLISLKSDFSSYVRFFLASDSSLHGCTLLLPRSAFSRFGWFNESLKTTQDYDMWFRIAEGYKFIGTDEVLVKARQHKNQGTVTMSSIVKKECDELVLSFVKNMSLNDIAATGLDTDSAYLKLAEVSYRRGLIVAARTALDKVSGKKIGAILRVRFLGELLCFLRSARSVLKRGRA